MTSSVSKPGAGQDEIQSATSACDEEIPPRSRRFDLSASKINEAKEVLLRKAGQRPALAGAPRQVGPL